MASMHLHNRQATLDGGYSDDGGPPATSWWWSSAGIAVRYSIVIVLFLLIFGYFVGGYLHAKRRMQRGLQPLPYHRWMVRRQMYYAAQYPYAPHAAPAPQRPQYNPVGESFYGAAHRHTAPPPAYNANQPPPPVYEPAGGAEGGKIAADQHYNAPVHRVGESSSNVPPYAGNEAGIPRQ